MREQRVALEHDAAIRGRLRHDRLAVDEELALRGRLHAEQHLQEGRFPAARGADDRDELMIGDIEIHVLEHDVIVVRLPQILRGDTCHGQRAISAQGQARERIHLSSQSIANASAVIHTTYGRITSIAR